MIKLKEIQMYPTNWFLDVIIIPKRISGKVVDFLSGRYGFTKEYCEEHILPDNWVGQCSTITSTGDSALKGERRFCVIVNQKSLSIISHELIHVMWHFANEIELEMDYSTQEWQAVLYEYMIVEAMKNDYKKIR